MPGHGPARENCTRGDYADKLHSWPAWKLGGRILQGLKHVKLHVNPNEFFKKQHFIFQKALKLGRRVNSRNPGQAVCLFVLCLPAYAPACPSVCLSVCLPACPVCLFVCLSACLPVCLPVCLFVGTPSMLVFPFVQSFHVSGRHPR